ncbi:MAG: 50S ribosomal protein L13 [Chloroflexota bacterium]
MKTYSPKAKDFQPEWYLIDATDQPLGRLATRVAHLLRGKQRPLFAPHMNAGDHVVIVNATKVRLTGRKPEQKKYFRHSGHPGGFREVVASVMIERRPRFVVEHAVKGMLPHNTLGRAMLKRLKVYDGPAHPHKGQLNETIEETTS